MAELFGFATADAAIFGPFLAMMVLTLVVWIVMYVRRIRYVMQHRIHPQTMTTPERLAELIPEEIALAANNLKNLFELPVLFYAMCLYLYVTGSTDTAYLVLAWAFVVLRAAHSIVHITVNIVMLRFYLYLAASVAFWIMLIRAVFA